MTAGPHVVKPLDGNEDTWRCSCGAVFRVESGWVICPAAQAEMTLLPGELIPDPGQRRYHARMLTATVTGICALDRQPWPCHVVQVLDAMDAADAATAIVMRHADDLADAVTAWRQKMEVSDGEVRACPDCHCPCGRPHIPVTVFHYAANGRLCPVHEHRLAAAVRLREVEAALKAWPPRHADDVAAGQ